MRSLLFSILLLFCTFCPQILHFLLVFQSDGFTSLYLKIIRPLEFSIFRCRCHPCHLLLHLSDATANATHNHRSATKDSCTSLHHGRHTVQPASLSRASLTSCGAPVGMSRLNSSGVPINIWVHPKSLPHPEKKGLALWLKRQDEAKRTSHPLLHTQRISCSKNLNSKSAKARNHPNSSVHTFSMCMICVCVYVCMYIHGIM